MLNKQQLGNYLRPVVFQDALQYVCAELYNDMRERFQEDRIVTDDMRPFIKRQVISGSLGAFQYPDDYVYLVNYEVGTAVSATDCGEAASIKWYVGEIVTTDEALVRDKSVVKAARIYRSYAEQLSNTLEVRPLATHCRITYLREQVLPVFGYTVTAAGVVYDPNTSTELEWPSQVHEAILDRLVIKASQILRNAVHLQTTRPSK